MYNNVLKLPEKTKEQYEHKKYCIDFMLEINAFECFSINIELLGRFSNKLFLYLINHPKFDPNFWNLIAVAGKHQDIEKVELLCECMRVDIYKQTENFFEKYFLTSYLEHRTMTYLLTAQFLIENHFIKIDEKFTDFISSQYPRGDFYYFCKKFVKEKKEIEDIVTEVFDKNVGEDVRKLFFTFLF